MYTRTDCTRSSASFRLTTISSWWSPSTSAIVSELTRYNPTMSFDLDVWEGATPASDAVAAARYLDLARALASEDEPPRPAFTAFIEAVRAKLPDAPGSDVVWATMPIDSQARGPIVLLNLRFDRAEAAVPVIHRLAAQHGLVLYAP